MNKQLCELEDILEEQQWMNL